MRRCVHLVACLIFVAQASAQSVDFSRTEAAPRRGPSPNARLKVQNESVGADELWLPRMSELQRRARDSSTLDLEKYVARESAVMIPEKIAEMLLYQKAKLRMSPAMEKKVDEFVDAELRRRVTEQYGGVQRRLERELESWGWSLEGYRTQLRRQVVVSTYLDDEVRPRVEEPSRAQLMEAFHQRAERLRKPARRSMSLIDIRVSAFLPEGISDPTREQVEEARTRARARSLAAQADIHEGMPFAEAARKYSHAANAQDGGRWGFVSLESVQERFLPAVRRLETLGNGQVSGVVETPDSFFLVRCDELDPGVSPDFLSIQPQLRDELFTEAYNRAIGKLVDELRKAARVEPENLESFHVAVVNSGLQHAARLRRDSAN